MKKAVGLILLIGVLFLVALESCAAQNGQNSNDTLQTEESETTQLWKDEEEPIIETTDTQKEEDVPTMNELYTPCNPQDMKAMWLSQFDMTKLYCTNGRQRSKEDFCRLFERMLDRITEMGINTVIVQIRPYADSFYPSEIYPMSKYVVGSYGKEADYDVFAEILTLAHRRGLSVHAWINPLRGMTTEELAAVPQGYAIRDWYDDTATRGRLVVVHTDGRVYLNPAYAEVRTLIADGVREIVSRYEVDGVHMDDYFYPSGCKDSFDDIAYLQFRREGGTGDRMSFRRAQINALVRELYATVKAENEQVLFGISPGGNMETNYNKLGADVATWCSQPGYVDYICPQVYWGMEHQTYDFSSVCKRFDSMIKVDHVRLIIGMTVSKAKSGYDQYAGSGAYEWSQHKDVLYRCLLFTKTLEHCSGVSYFCYQYFYDPLAGVSVRETEAERALLIPELIKISWSEN